MCLIFVVCTEEPILFVFVLVFCCLNDCDNVKIAAQMINHMFSSKSLKVACTLLLHLPLIVPRQPMCIDKCMNGEIFFAMISLVAAAFSSIRDVYRYLMLQDIVFMLGMGTSPRPGGNGLTACKKIMYALQLLQNSIFFTMTLKLPQKLFSLIVPTKIMHKIKNKCLGN